MSHPTSTQAQFLTLRAQGLSYDNIAKDLRVSKHTLLSWAREFPPRIDTQLRAAYEKYQTALATRVEILAQQFQTVSKLITSCDPMSSAYPRFFNILLKLHAALEKFDLAPENLSLDSTESAPVINSEQNLCHSWQRNPSESFEAGIQKFIDRYRKYFKADPSEHVFRYLENARKEATRQAS
jgi:hypothetical protein